MSYSTSKGFINREGDKEEEGLPVEEEDSR